MKNIKVLYLILASCMLTFSACEPNVEEDYLGNNVKIEDVELKATNTTTGGNEVTLEMSTPGVTGYWDYVIGKGLTNRTTIVFPVTGTFNFKYKGTLGAEFFEKTVPVTINVLDHPVPPEWTALLGTDAAAGKTWVFDGGPSPDGRQWWFMSDPNNPMGIWWNAAGDCCPPSDAAGKMHFDLDGALNFTYYSGPLASPSAGSFELNVKNQQLIVVGTNILGAEGGGGNPSGIYTIVELTEDKMILFIPNGPWGTGWTYVYKPE